jgi:hypothetical protein
MRLSNRTAHLLVLESSSTFVSTSSLELLLVISLRMLKDANLNPYRIQAYPNSIDGAVVDDKDDDSTSKDDIMASDMASVAKPQPTTKAYDCLIRSVRGKTEIDATAARATTPLMLVPLTMAFLIVSTWGARILNKFDKCAAEGSARALSSASLPPRILKRARAGRLSSLGLFGERIADLVVSEEWSVLDGRALLWLGVTVTKRARAKAAAVRVVMVGSMPC